MFIFLISYSYYLTVLVRVAVARVIADVIVFVLNGFAIINYDWISQFLVAVLGAFHLTQPDILLTYGLLHYG